MLWVCRRYSIKVIVVGDVLDVALDGRIVFMIFACCFGSFFVFSSLSVIVCLLVCFMSLWSLFLYCLCFLMLSGVGLCNRSSYSLCCFLILRLYLGSHHVFRRGLGVFSYFSIVCLSDCCMCSNCSEVVRCVLVCIAFVIAVCASVMIVFLSLVYLFMVSVLVLFVCCVIVGVEKIVYTLRWSVIGGEMVPAVAFVCESDVSITSMRVFVWCLVSYLVGVVIVVCKLFSMRKWWSFVFM